MIITAEWLEEQYACPNGLEWFEKNYPDGLKITKENIAGLFERLNKREKRFGPILWPTIEDDTNAVMDWLLDSLSGCLTEDYYSYWRKNENITITTIPECVELWWKDYKNNGGK